MNLGDGLLFELENGKPKLILLSHGAEKNPAKQLSFKPRAANILNSRQPSCVEEAQGGERPARQQLGRRRETKSKAGGAAASFTSNTTTGGRSSTLASSKTHDYLKGGNVKVVAKVKSDRHKHSMTVGSLRTNGKTAQPQSSGTQASGNVGLKDSQAGGHAGLKDSVVCLTSEQLQHILHSVHTSNQSQHTPEDPRRQDSKTGSLINGGRGSGEMKEEDRGGGTDNTATSQDKDNRLSGCPFSWLEERQTLSRATIDAKKAQWRRELDEQVALKQQQSSAPGRLQAEDDTESVYSVQSSISHRDQPAAIRSSLRLGVQLHTEVTPMEEVLCVERREEQRRRWLEELDRQREETSERRRREKLLQSQTEDHELWAAHFDSLQRRPPVQTAAPSAPPATPSRLSEQGEWDPSSSLSLLWEAASSCGAESVVGASIDTTSGYPGRASHLRTMTALLDPTQIEEREKRRLKQLDQQRAIEAQVEERRRQKEQEETRRREEEKEDERRVALEREMLERQYEIDTQREKQKSTNLAEQLEKDDDDKKSQQDMQEPSAVNRQSECLEREEVSSSASPYRDTAVQTEAAATVQTPDVAAQYQPPPPASSVALPNSRTRAMTTGKENICLPEGGGGGGDPYEAFARTDRSRRDKRRPEWNTQRPSRQFVPASERYPAALQRNRQESRQRRQAELLALQERTCLSRADPPPQQRELSVPSNPTQTRTSPTRKVESVSRGLSIAAAVSPERGRSPPLPAVRLRVQVQPVPPSSSSPPPLEFIPYVRTDEVFNLDPLEPADTPPPQTHTEAPSISESPPSHRFLHPELLRNTHTHRQQEILRGLAQLRQGLLQKQRELETDLNPLLKRHDKEQLPPSSTHRM
ncbi:coiled-coil domain-containing protein 66 isoform X1 [Pseudochaenichthys georgianus]|uniref:coiled-coil domain-containing protein 66 isoform X1 n=1 Tax=Pseudochaenichthys georgianus TaxID=52239 RepID=UPI00146BF936|nr:coiled-coil domain-containing protein 66 isoform X1 [Pseudochaenichthys georgianus]